MDQNRIDMLTGRTKRLEKSFSQQVRVLSVLPKYLSSAAFPEKDYPMPRGYFDQFIEEYQEKVRTAASTYRGLCEAREELNQEEGR